MSEMTWKPMGDGVDTIEAPALAQTEGHSVRPMSEVSEPSECARDRKHDEVLARLFQLARRPAGFKAAEIRDVAEEAHDWLRVVMSDLRGHEAAAKVRDQEQRG